ncbi:MAG TPA: hypothetical protein VFM07_03770 [Intrasporangium sp.]|nr:hypothetical protein [Intrasporangium sp.]
MRDGAIAHDPDRADQVVAACPDSPERGDEWRWTVSRTRVDHPGRTWQVSVTVDEDFVGAEHLVVDEPGERPLTRGSGEEIVVVAEHGRHLVQDASGPWLRYLDTGDVFVVEGEDPEHLVLTAGADSRASVVRLTPKGSQPLRWVP